MHIRTLAEFMRLSYGDRIDHVLYNHEDAGFLLSVLRTAASEADIVMAYKAFLPVFDDLALPAFDGMFLAALAARPTPLCVIKQLMAILRLQDSTLSQGLKHVRLTWPSGYKPLSDPQFGLHVLARLIEAGADPTQTGVWRPLGNSAARPQKLAIARVLVRRGDLTERKLDQWLEHQWLLPEDADLVREAWALRKEDPHPAIPAMQAPATIAPRAIMQTATGRLDA